MNAIHDFIHLAKSIARNDDLWNRTLKAAELENAITDAAYVALTDSGFSVSVRKVKGEKFLAECHDWSDVEHRAVYGRGDTWHEAVRDAANSWAIGAEA